MTEPNEIVAVLDEEEGWEFLRSHEFGRLAYRVGNATDIAPVNYVVDGHRLVFLTSQGSKLAGVAITQDVAFEVDHIGTDEATSVVAHGLARHLTG
ncbi:pyridoxamine 5'-phosphate oxidase family protein, partial [Actinotalea sp.]|uniref:pyridoxamine 5'-phosphate oxidase family protein n=1 Tax=Actinotalea sp. TaxID=1872145 RepID=UPI003563972E